MSPLRTALAFLLLAGSASAQITDVALAKITDQHGNAPPMSAPFGRMLVFSGKQSVAGDKPASIKWKITPSALDERKWQPSSLEFAVTPEPMDADRTPYMLTVFLSVAKGDTVDHCVLMVKCGEGDIPPPDPKPRPNPQPDPNADALTLAVIDDPLTTTADTRIILNNVAYWQTLKTRGHGWRFYAPNTTEADGVAAVNVMKARQLGPPSIVVTNPRTGVREAYKLPANTDGIDLIIRKHTTR